ncbi:RidA family protein [Sinorhizobium americanum]|uniref:Enamine deaminase RidA (YjgF/YER057c/UK114 family) n=1 Tax=Sinorhizobium americanum TaxID=194963 RepID=A0A4R2B298_9HYPH|nr:RidA family protein [Sinorhizobium americanum]TCN20353.1 enamine deaminase RidA (YjgF/YER057c/UK114 family) [Sinorhizobium americanum]
MKAEAKSKAVVPYGNYLVAKRHRDLVFTAGMTPRSAGVLAHTGAITNEHQLEHYKEAVELAASNALAAAGSVVQRGEKIGSVLTLTVYLSTIAEFTGHSRIADFASNYLLAELGQEGIGTRAAVGVISLPGGAVVELQMTAIIEEAPEPA